MLDRRIGALRRDETKLMPAVNRRVESVWIFKAWQTSESSCAG